MRLPGAIFKDLQQTSASSPRGTVERARKDDTKSVKDIGLKMEEYFRVMVFSVYQ